MDDSKSAISDMQRSIDAYVEEISEKHRLHRKIQFLLDIRGLFIINRIKGIYVEFGVFRGEMMYSAAKILSPHISKYIGLDTFTGLPEPDREDSKLFVYKTAGFMSSPKKVAEQMMEQFDFCFIEGDFRKQKTLEEYKNKASKISLLIIDCNWPSSINVALKASAPFLQHGSVVFLDDYFAGTRHRNFHDQILAEEGGEYNVKFIEFKTYPPSARAYIVETNE